MEITIWVAVLAVVMNGTHSTISADEFFKTKEACMAFVLEHEPEAKDAPIVQAYGQGCVQLVVKQKHPV